MYRFILFLAFAFIGSKSFATKTSDLFDVDFENIEKKFERLEKTELQIIESGEIESPLSLSFEIPLDSLNQDFPIYGIPTFFWVFLPTCAGNCIMPCTGSIYGISSVFYINYFSKNQELKKEALAGCLAGQIPLFGYLVAFVLAYNI